MFGQLFESAARAQRRTGGATLSVALHVTIIGAAVVATASGKSAPPAKVEMVSVRFAAPPHPVPHPQPQHASTPAPSTFAPPRDISITVVNVPTFTPTSMPAIDLTHGAPADSIVIGLGAGAGHDGRAGLGDLLTTAPSDGELRGSELLMRIVTSAKPRYPESLRQAGIDGRVLVRFVVDTLGGVDMNSVEILSSTHELFTKSVRDALAGFRFRPSEVRGKRVRSLAEMPFEFAISR